MAAATPTSYTDKILVSDEVAEFSPAIIDELYKTRRVSDKNYKRVHAVLGDSATVELVGILGYYSMISMVLNIYRMMPPQDATLPFAEK